MLLAGYLCLYCAREARSRDSHHVAGQKVALAADEAAACANDLALTMIDQQRYDDAAPILASVYAYATKPENSGNTLLPEAVNNMGSLHMAKGEFDKAEPFFLYVPFNAVHTPIQATDKYLARFPDVKDLKRRTFYAMTSGMDDAVGRVLESLEENSLTDNTLVIFCDDNGGPTYTGVQSNGPLRFGKLFLFEGGVRVPLIMKWPGVIAENQENDAIVSTLDLFPTLSRIAGAELPESLALDGVDLTDLLRGEQAELNRGPLFWRNGSNKAQRMGKWKMIEVPDHVWLFDLETDIGEKTNLADQHPEVVRKMQQQFQSWEAELPNPAWPARPDRRHIMIDGVVYEIQI